TDVHYFPLSYGYLGGDTDFSKKVITSSKLTVESHLYVMEALEQIVEENPDYLVVTGDLTTDGEIQAHVEVANLLRQTQNRVRENGNEDFQIFVIFGNHDLYNEEAFDYSQDGSARLLPNATRYDMTKVYSSLGYPDLTDDEIATYYDTKADLTNNLCPYDDAYVSGNSTSGIKFVNSTTATTTNIEWIYRENGAEQALINGEITDYDQGEISYVANVLKDYVVVGIDDGVSTVETQHHLGGILHENIQDFLSAKKSAGEFDGKNLMSLSHRNVLPHFTGEDSLLKDFTYYNTFETADFLADLGVRYSYSGHMHANDIESRVSLNGNLITDVETASATGYNAAVRYTKIERGSVGEDYAENFSTYIKKTETIDITSLVEMGYIDDAYFARYDLEPFIEVKGGKTIITDAAGYSANKVLLKIVDNMVYSYVDVDFIGNAGEMVAGMLPEGNAIVDMIKPLAEVLINNLVIHFEDVVLADYTYAGNNPDFKGTERGAKLCGYVDELLQEALNMPVNSQGLGLFDFVINSYLDHIGGRDVPYADLDDGMKEAMELFADGTNVEKLINILLDEESGLLRIVKGLLMPIDLGKGMSDSDVNLLKTVFKIIDPKVNTDPHAVVLDNLVPGALDLLAGLGVDLGIDLGNEGLGAFIDHLIDSYVTESLYTSLGEIAKGIIYSFKVDETANMENSFDGYTVYKHDARLSANYVAGALDTTPTVARGQLPGMITVTFGEDPTTTKNIVWFTDKSITGTDI
ncbi:MAG: metallophosphoesterase, partial [Clostridia bacterium]|nr:metallophosphoesterase [Clostridia bacterium]